VSLHFPNDKWLKKYIPGESRAAREKRAVAISSKEVLFADRASAEKFKEDLESTADYSAGNMGGAGIRVEITESMKLSQKQLLQIVNEAFEDLERTSLEFDTSKLPSERDEIASIYSDVFKEKNGIRPRWKDWSNYTTEEMQKELDDLYAQLDSYDWDEALHEPEIEEPKFKMGGEVDPGDIDRYEDMPMRTSFHGRVHRPGRVSAPSTRSKHSIKKESMMKLTQLRSLIQETFEEESRSRASASHKETMYMIDKSIMYLQRAKETWARGQDPGSVYDDVNMGATWAKKAAIDIMGV